ncbi:MAG: two-component regulator propeller domain-containing protein [Bacteroidota bacterium]
MGKYTTLLIWCCGWLGLTAQEYSFTAVTIEDGLSQSTVNAMVQDQRGFLWIGTQDGLNCYDGHRFKVYKKDPFDTSSIADNYISNLYVDYKDRLWIGTMKGGLSMLDARRERIRNYDHEAGDSGSLSDNRVNLLFEDRQSRLWVATPKGFDQIIEQADGKLHFKRHQFLRDKRPSAGGFTITSVLEEDYDHWWVTTFSGVFYCRLDEDGQIVEVEHPLSTWFQEEGQSWGRIAGRICKDRQGRLWVGSQRGLICYTPSTAAIQTYELGNNEPGYKSVRIFDICLTTNDKLLVAGNNGLHVLNYADGAYASSFQQIRPGEQERLRSFKHPMTILEDRLHKGLYWVGTDLSGLVRVYERKKKFQTDYLEVLKSDYEISSSVFQIVEDTLNRLWLGTPDGIAIYDKQKSKYRFFPEINCKNFRIKAASLNTLFRDAEGTIWAGTYNGPLRLYFNRRGMLCADHYLQGYECESPAVFSIYEEAEVYYLGSFAGINFLDKSTNTIEPCPIIFDTVQQERFDYTYTSFLRDKDSNLWVGTSRGLLFFRDLQGSLRDHKNKTPEFYHYDRNDKNSLVDDHINHIMEDRSGEVWLATMNGLVKAHPTSKGMHFESYSEKDGLANNVVYGMLEEADGYHIWLSTNNGLSRFDPRNGRFYNFNLRDGLQSNEFNAHAFYKNDEGELFFGGINGVTRFFPDQIQLEEQMPPVWITDLTTFSGRHYNLLDIANRSSIKLDYYENSFSVHFTGLDFLYPDELNYYYDLEGGYARNMPIGNNQQLNFNALAPGEYSLCVKAASKDGVFNYLGDSIHICILAPFWQTSWFYAFLVLSTLLLAGLGYHLVYRFKLRKVAEIDAVRKLAAQDFHDELGSKLSIISMYSELTKKQLNGAVKYAPTYLNKVITTSNSLYDSMKDMLWALNPEQDTIHDLFLHLKDFGEELFSHSETDFHSLGIESDWGDKLLPMQYKRHILLIFKEAMNNSLRHSKASTITLKMSNVRNILTVEVGDNGKGFQETMGHRGEGLNNMESRARRISGKLFVSTSSTGTLVKLVCPLS